MRSFFFLSILLTAMPLTACRKHSVTISPPPPAPTPANTLVAGTLIKGSGTWTHSELGTNRSFTATVVGSGVNWKYHHSGPGRGGSTSTGFPLAKPSDPWFIYVGSPDHLWIFDGSSELTFWRWEPDERGDAITNGVLKIAPEEVPAGLVPHLPAGLQKLLPAEATKPRPSI